jgi:hypothetical protein
MIRHGSVRPRKAVESTAPAREFFREVFARSSRGPWVLLAGGADVRHVRVRLAQSVVRYDERPSAWSHVALLLDVDPDEPLRSTGVEVRFDQTRETGPERHYVSFFSLADYADPERFPNLGLVTLRPKKRDKTLVTNLSSARRKDGKTLVKRVATHALDPSPARATHSFGAWLSAWSAHLFDPSRVQNPLLANVPVPSAGFVDYVFAASGVNLTPAASTPAICPEHLWASVRRFDHPDYLVRYASRRLEPRAASPIVQDENLREAYRAFRERR